MPENLCTLQYEVFVVDCASDWTAVSLFLFLLASTVPKFLIVTVFRAAAVHIAQSAVGAFDFACKTAGVQTLVC